MSANVVALKDAIEKDLRSIYCVPKEQKQVIFCDIDEKEIKFFMDLEKMTCELNMCSSNIGQAHISQYTFMQNNRFSVLKYIKRYKQGMVSDICGQIKPKGDLRYLLRNTRFIKMLQVENQVSKYMLAYLATFFADCSMWLCSECKGDRDSSCSSDSETDDCERGCNYCEEGHVERFIHGLYINNFQIDLSDYIPVGAKLVDQGTLKKAIYAATNLLCKRVCGYEYVNENCVPFEFLAVYLRKINILTDFKLGALCPLYKTLVHDFCTDISNLGIDIVNVYF